MKYASIKFKILLYPRLNISNSSSTDIIIYCYRNCIFTAQLENMDAKKIAQTILEAYDKREPISPLRESISDSNADLAYEVQKITTQHWLDQDRRLVGRKIGLTSKAVQQQLGVDQPDFGALFADMAYGSGDIIPSNRLLQGKAEAEICFVLGEDLDFDHHTVADVVDAIDFMLPAIEIADSRIANWDIKFFDTVCDNASSGLFVLGNKPSYLEDVDLELCGMAMFKNGEPVSTGAGKACLGNPLNAVRWLANKMVEVGDPLQAGDLILSGALGPMVNVGPGDHIVSSISGMSDVQLILSK